MATSTSLWRPARRDILRSLSAALSAGLLAGRPPATAVRQPSLNFPSDARARLAVTSYPFRGFINSPKNHDRNPNLPGMDIKDFPAFVAENFGVFNINPLANHFASTEPSYLDGFRAAVKKAHSQIVDLGLPGGRFYAADTAVRQEAVVSARKFVDMAVQVGSPRVRQHVQGRSTEKPDVSLASASLGELAEYGEKNNVVINLENDNPVAEDPFFLVAVIEKVNSPYLRALPDFGNSLIGHDPDFNKKAIKAMLKHAYNMCHVKDIVEGADGKPYRVDLGTAFELAQKSRYLGFFSMEVEIKLGDPIAGTKRLVDETLRYLG
jgi:sugar phosphate isomerase/epimerase